VWCTYSACNLLQSPVTYSLLGPNIFLNALFWINFSLFFSRNVKDLFMNSYKTGNNITVLYILTFIFI
jgi:hypothetical protein